MRALFVAAAVALALPAAAAAHASLVRTSPPNGAVLERAPAAVRVVFDDAVRRGPGIRAIRNGGRSVLAGTPRVEGGKTLVIPLRTRLPHGDYSIRWAIVSDDGHLESGVLAFAVGAGRAPPTAQLSPEATGAQPSRVASRWLFLGGILAAVGIALFALLTRAEEDAVALVLASAAVAAALGAADAAHVSGLSTRAGAAFFATSVYGVVVALAGAVATMSPRALRPALVLALPLVAAPTLSGHALDRGLPRVNVAVDLLHVAGASAWAGALIGLCTTPHVRRAVQLAAGGVAVLALTGVVRASYELLHVSQLWHTNYGRSIVVKTAIFVVALAAGRLLRPQLRRRAAVELVLVAAVVAVASVLVLERPGRNVVRAVAPASASEPGPEPPLPPRDAIVVARRLGVYGVALAAEPERLTALVLSPAGGGADGLDVQIDGHDTSACGHGCYRVDERHGAHARVTVDGETATIPSPLQKESNRASLAWFVRFFQSSRSVEYIERLASSPTNVLVARWRLEAPDRVSYAIRGGAQAVVIGGRRWDRDSPNGRWRESPQTPLRQPVVPWTRATNVWQISTHQTVFVDPTIPAYFELEAHELPTSLRMVAAAHFMEDRYVSFGTPRRVRAPR
ncbi:MAG TPA: copper resistance protein CopC [Gaiellaceae bacterium]